MSRVCVSILMGSDSDYETLCEGAKVLEDFGIPYEMKVLSAHRSPDAVAEFSRGAKAKGVKVIIAGAGGAAHLAGVIAAHTVLPVIGVPINATPLAGFDALLATVQMPAGVPVATVAVGKAGARNAAILAIQMLALSDAKLSAALDDFKKGLAAGVAEKNKKLSKTLGRRKSPS